MMYGDQNLNHLSFDENFGSSGSDDEEGIITIVHCSLQ